MVRVWVWVAEENTPLEILTKKGRQMSVAAPQPATVVAHWSIFKQQEHCELCNAETVCFDLQCLLLSFPLFLQSGEGDAVCGAEAHYGQAAWARGCWAALPLPEVPAGADQEAQGPTAHFSSCFIVVFLSYFCPWIETGLIFQLVRPWTPLNY